ncbi:MAG: hypothetical protein F9K43_25425 [Bauldia sp.]|nr:MAG: hypothetical protein F9K43_25425 [Bauldia sp.]
MKRLLLIAVVASLVVAAPAAAKGLRWVEVCGPSECRRTPEGRIESETLIFPPWVMFGAPDGPPARAGRWLRVRVAPARSNRIMKSVLMPGVGYAGGDQGGGYGFVWERLGRDARATYRMLGRGVERYPVATARDLAAMSFAMTVTGSVRRPLTLTVTAFAKRIVASLPG